ncbi:endonuclease/exonuclease/phosphatase family protein [Sulfurovum sp. zt1-1]|uniref:Endonuclease/exonuclease/phosphatase family protein n=1 Tax=Sulfurovum zhangzhouensis TaxID=3019067 RepID=A0ABT7QWF3_9BACT|nr:endonuclease/exonuclease/phosphatase family protein [Sulfurovum zhangzhouensis]MDM5271166.1 endonuclease/exonuclease/phosphatase family protein [Sulfurovum zhangzhouensis]
MRIFLLLILPFLLFAKPFKVATYNVENLFDASYSGTEYEEYTQKHNWTERIVDIKLNHTAEVICDLDADILGVQEIENESILRALQKKLDEVGCGYAHLAITHKKGASVQIGVLSRFPIKSAKEIEVSKASGVRNTLDAVVEVQNYPIHIFVNHWKSRSREGWESKRIVYAKALQKHLQALPQGVEYILLGDFNTDYDAAWYLEKRINDTQGATGLHHILHATEDSSQLFKENGAHYMLWSELNMDARWNFKFYGKQGTPDHILLPRTMVDGRGIDYIDGTFGVFRRPYLFTERGYINSWEYKEGKHRGRGYSDHLPLYAYFDTKPYQHSKAVNILSQREVQPIEYLYTVEQLSHEVLLKDAVVIWKQGRNALIKQSVNGRGIFLYGCADGLEEEREYDLLVRGIKSYHGLKEITHAYSLKEKAYTDNSKYFLTQTDLSNPIAKRQNEIFKSLTGVYKDGYFYASGRKIPIHFKKRKQTPPNGAKLKIAYAHLGYYKNLQLVVYSPNDFTVLEK